MDEAKRSSQSGQSNPIDQSPSQLYTTTSLIQLITIPFMLQLLPRNPILQPISSTSIHRLFYSISTSYSHSQPLPCQTLEIKHQNPNPPLLPLSPTKPSLSSYRSHLLISSLRSVAPSNPDALTTLRTLGPAYAFQPYVHDLTGYAYFLATARFFRKAEIAFS